MPTLSNPELAEALEGANSLILRWGHNQMRQLKAEEVERIVAALKASASSETGPSVAVADLDIIGRREKGDEDKGRAWWSGGTWLRPGEVVAVLTLPPERQGG